MSPTITITRNNAGGFPRVSGDEPVATWMSGTLQSFSPRERG